MLKRGSRVVLAFLRPQRSLHGLLYLMLLLLHANITQVQLLYGFDYEEACYIIAQLLWAKKCVQPTVKYQIWDQGA